MEKQTKLFFPNLDALRFIAFLFVFFEHIMWGAFRHLPLHDKPLLEHILYTLFCNGGMGVSIFFVLSGFLITYLVLSEIELTNKIDVKAFYIRRALRIWPLYYAVLIFVFFLYPFVQHHLQIYQETCARPIYYFSFLSNFDLIHISQNCLSQGTMQSGVTWSVAIEEQFYLVWPLLFWLLPKKLYQYAFYAIIVIALVFRILHYNDSTYIYFHTLGVVGDLALGALVAYYALNSNKFKLFFENLKPNFVYITYFVGIVFLLVGEYYIVTPYYVALARFISILFFGFLIAHQNFSKTDALKLGKLKFFTKWGKYTYGLYLLHPIGSIIGTFLFKKIYTGADSFLVIFTEGIIIFMITLVISYISFHFFESHFLKLKKRFSYITKE
jgi:peptidoglycan/LPS O-acetylase OafA/YrhL